MYSLVCFLLLKYELLSLIVSFTYVNYLLVFLINTISKSKMISNTPLHSPYEILFQVFLEVCLYSLQILGLS